LSTCGGDELACGVVYVMKCNLRLMALICPLGVSHLQV
jgi:hypothetical protein